MRLFRKSLLKRAKLKNIRALLGATEGKRCLDIGGDNGVISYFLRQQGGAWQSADLSPKAVASIGQLVGEDSVHLLEGTELPYQDDALDLIAIVDYLEHIEADAAFVKECHRVLPEGGQLLINVPHRKKGLIRPLRLMLGLTDERHGHVRPGYNQRELYELLKDGFDIVESRTYNRFFVELVDTGVQLVGSWMGGQHSEASDGPSKGVLIDRADFVKYQKAFRLYSLIYPFLVVASWLDRFLFFTRGHSLVVMARARRWNPRRQVKISDGRSIAEASLMSGKVGSAAEFR